ncbi:MAG: hypothetical protein RJA22_2444 [Verrucomicrobiota bacterium]
MRPVFSSPVPPSPWVRSIALLLLWLAALPLGAQTFKVVTWHSDDFPSPVPAAGVEDVEVRRMRQMAAVLKPYNADVLVIEGLVDKQAAQRLVAQMKPQLFSLASFHVFRAGAGANAQMLAPSVTVLSRKAPLTARTADWRGSGQVDAPGGFHFVAVPVGTNLLCLYDSQFVDPPAALTNARVAQLNLRKRDLAAQYLLHHMRWMGEALTNPAAAFFLMGNLAAGPASHDAALKTLEQGGFRRPAPLAGGEAGLLSPRQWLVRNAEFGGVPRLGTPRGWNYGPVVFELSPKAPGPAPTVAQAAPSGVARPGPAPSSLPAAVAPVFRKFAVDERVFWLVLPVAAAAALLLVLLVPYRWAQARRQTRALALRHRSRNAVLVDFAPAPGELGPTGVAGALPGTGESGAAEWAERARAAEQQASKAAAAVREGLMPQLVRLMREKLFQRLTSQRAQLLDSQLHGTMAVLELEERLEKIQGQFANRLAAREQRIAELEAELAAKENIVRELIKAQARLAGRASNE